MVLDDTVDMVWLAENLLHFYRHESCGKCTPCREGTDWLYKLLHRMLQRRGLEPRHHAAQERRRSDQRQDAVRLRRRGGDAGADDAEVLQARVRGLRQRRSARRRPTTAPRSPPARITRGPMRRVMLDTLLWPFRPPQNWWVAYAALVGGLFLALQISAAVMVYAERKVAALMQQRYGPWLVGPQGPAAADRRHRQAVLQGGAAAEGRRQAAVLAGADHLGGHLLHRLRAGAVRRHHHVLRLARRADRPPGRRPERRRPVRLRHRLDRRLRHRAGRLGQQLEVLAARRPAQLGADDQLRAGLRHGAGHHRAAGRVDVVPRDRRRPGRLLLRGRSRAGTCS